MWCGNHWQPVSCDAKQIMSSTCDDKTGEERVHTMNSACSNCQHRLNDAKALLSELTSLQLHSIHTSSDCSSSSINVLQHYSRCLEYEEKLVKLFDNMVTITAKEDLLHSLR